MRHLRLECPESRARRPNRAQASTPFRRSASRTCRVQWRAIAFGNSLQRSLMTQAAPRSQDCYLGGSFLCRLIIGLPDGWTSSKSASSYSLSANSLGAPMPAKPIRSPRLPDELPDAYNPLLPTVVVASYKGGVGKTAVAVACAERLAWAGLHILLLTCDSQEDARARLGVQTSESLMASRAYGSGSITVAGIRGAKAIDLLYRLGTDHLGRGTFDMAVLDTPPEVQGGSLPGVLLITPLDGMDAARNLITMLRRTLQNSDIIMIRVGRADAGEWAQNADAISEALGRQLEFLEEPLPKSALIADAHNQGRSVWTLRRSGPTQTFLHGINALSQMIWERFNPRRPWPTQLPAAPATAYVPGWDDET